MAFKKSEFSEMQEDSDIMNPSSSIAISPEEHIPMTQLQAQDDNDLERIPIEDTWSWNPVDWVYGIYHEIRDFRNNFVLTERKRTMYRAIMGEGLVTFLFMFIVMATSINNGRQDTPATMVLGAISTALASVALIYSFADVSGAHFNPAVTFATMITGKTSVRKGFAYIGIQLFASVFATLALMAVFPAAPDGNHASIPAYVVVDLHPTANLVNAFCNFDYHICEFKIKLRKII